MLIFFIAIIIRGGISQPCDPLGSNLIATSGVPDTGFFVNNDSTAVCGGVATRWNYCFYGNTTSANSSAVFQVYRRLFGNNTYTVVPNSVTTLSLNTSNIGNSLNFTCGNISTSSSFIVQPGDVIAVCTSGKQPLGVIGSNMHGSYANMLLHGTASKCGIPFDPTDNSIVSSQKKILHVYLDIDESSTNNGGSALNCTNGYEMLPNGSCVDINECSINNGGCIQNCTNSNGSFMCGCEMGYVLTLDQTSCKINTTATAPTASPFSVDGLIGGLLGLFGMLCVIALAAAITTYYSCFKLGKTKRRPVKPSTYIQKHALPNSWTSRTALTTAECLSEHQLTPNIGSVIETDVYYISPEPCTLDQTRTIDIEMTLNVAYGPLPCRTNSNLLSANPKEDSANDYLQVEA